MQTTSDAQHMDASGSYSRHWRAYTRHRLFLVCLLVGWIPATRLADVLLVHLHLPSFLLWVFPIVWILLTVTEGGRLALWPCPSCGERFRGTFGIFLPKRCQ